MLDLDLDLELDCGFRQVVSFLITECSQVPSIVEGVSGEGGRSEYK